ncbi:MAG: family 16 glycoside hydrolase, partial [Rhodothermales bacterium]
IAIEGATSDVRGRMVEGRYTYDPNAELHTISRQGFDPSGVSGAARITQSADFPEPGRWNTIELYALGRTSIHVVNGTVNMALFNSRKYVDGQESPLDRGKIQFQSEGAEIFLRNRELRRIDEIPAHLLEAVQPTR